MPFGKPGDRQGMAHAAVDQRLQQAMRLLEVGQRQAMHQADGAHQQGVGLERRQRAGSASAAARAPSPRRRRRRSGGRSVPARRSTMPDEIVVQALDPQDAPGLGLRQLDVELETRLGRRDRRPTARSRRRDGRRSPPARRRGRLKAVVDSRDTTLRSEADCDRRRITSSARISPITPWSVASAARREGHDGDRRRQLVEGSAVCHHRLRAGRADAIGADRLGECRLHVAVAQILDIGVEVGGEAVAHVLGDDDLARAGEAHQPGREIDAAAAARRRRSTMTSLTSMPVRSMIWRSGGAGGIGAAALTAGWQARPTRPSARRRSRAACRRRGS